MNRKQILKMNKQREGKWRPPVVRSTNGTPIETEGMANFLKKIRTDADGIQEKLDKELDFDSPVMIPNGDEILDDADLPDNVVLLEEKAPPNPITEEYFRK